jgi:hypothetical protein
MGRKSGDVGSKHCMGRLALENPRISSFSFMVWVVGHTWEEGVSEYGEGRKDRREKRKAENGSRQWDRREQVKGLWAVACRFLELMVLVAVVAAESVILDQW